MVIFDKSVGHNVTANEVDPRKGIVYGGSMEEMFDVAIDIHTKYWKAGGGSYWLNRTVSPMQIQAELIAKGVKSENIINLSRRYGGKKLSSNLIDHNILLCSALSKFVKNCQSSGRFNGNATGLFRVFDCIYSDMSIPDSQRRSRPTLFNVISTLNFMGAEVALKVIAQLFPTLTGEELSGAKRNIEVSLEWDFVVAKIFSSYDKLIELFRDEDEEGSTVELGIPNHHYIFNFNDPDHLEIFTILVKKFSYDTSFNYSREKGSEFKKVPVFIDQSDLINAHVAVMPASYCDSFYSRNYFCLPELKSINSVMESSIVSACSEVGACVMSERRQSKASDIVRSYVRNVELKHPVQGALTQFVIENTVFLRRWLSLL